MKYSMSKMLMDDMDTSLSFCREVSCFMTPKQGLITLTTDDSGGAVELDFFKIWQAIKDGEKNSHCFMIHTHPPGCEGMSGTDRNMVYGWCQALPMPIHYIIITQQMTHYWICQKNKVINGDDSNKQTVNRVYCGNFDYRELVYGKYFNALKLLSHTMYGLSKTNDPIDAECELEFKNNFDRYVDELEMQ